MVRNIFKGLGIALVTPFNADGSVDYKSLIRLVEYQLDNGADFLCILATTGETPTLTADEKQRIKETIVSLVGGRIPILMGCGGNNTSAIVEELQTRDFQGIDGILSVCPYYNKPSQEGLYQHFKAIANATKLPVVLYNVPGRTGVNMTAATTVRLANDCKNIVAIKEASGNLEQVDEIIKNKPNTFDVISGDDALTFPMVSCGAVGVISVIGNALPKEFSKMIRLQMRGEYDAARKIHHRFIDLFSLLFVDGNPAGVKAMLSEMGYIENVLRLPLVPMRVNNVQRMSEILKELNPLMGKDALYIADRRKKEFTYPIHNHEVFELNFVEHAPGVRRIVGDSNEVISDYDLVLITSPDLEHVWEQNTCVSDDIREITVQFYLDMSDDGFLSRNPFYSLRKMLKEARKGLAFPMSAIMRVYQQLDTLSSVKDGFYAVMQFMTILYELSRCTGARTLATSSFAKVEVESDSRRVLKVKNYIAKNYMDEIRLNTLADIAGMSPSAFSRFFKLHTGRNLSEYIIEMRLGYASRMLVDTAKSIAEISFQSGFNNLSNFNRIFKKKKGCSPSEFRENYHKTRIIV